MLRLLENAGSVECQADGEKRIVVETRIINLLLLCRGESAMLEGTFGTTTTPQECMLGVGLELGEEHPQSWCLSVWEPKMGRLT